MKISNQGGCFTYKTVFTLLTFSFMTLVRFPWKELKLSVEMKMEVALLLNLTAKKASINLKVTFLTQRWKGSLSVSYEMLHVLLVSS
jgi:hypothetical protein